MTWGRYVTDAVFRGGMRHSRYKDTVIMTVRHLTDAIRREYRADAVIVLTCDAGFSDQKNFKEFENNGIFYICGAPLTKDIRKITGGLPEDASGLLKKRNRHGNFPNLNTDVTHGINPAALFVAALSMKTAGSS